MNQPQTQAPAAASGTKPIRVIGYIDGYNLYHGMVEHSLRRYLWLDLNAMMRAMLKPNQVLVQTKYSTSRTSFPPEAVRRQTTYLEAVGTLPNLIVIEGRYDGEPANCKRCGEPYVRHNEKMTDVNIAVTIVNDAWFDLFDTALLVTGDSDQVPTIELVHRLWAPHKRVVCVFPPARKSKHLALVAKGTMNINEAVLRASQLPELIYKHGGIPLARPAAWTDTTTPGSDASQ